LTDHDDNVLTKLKITYITTGGPKVYDVSKYLDDHPGGAEVLLDVAGQDADEFFEDIGHSNDARDELKKYHIGNFKMDEATMAKMKAAAEKAALAKESGGSSMMLILIVLIAIAFGYYKTQMS
jgi:cytochrome b involved in lipid metabolism